MNRVACLFVAVAACAGCITTVNPVVFSRETGAPTVPARADGCSVDVVDDGAKFDRPHKLLGHVVLEWSASQMKDQGPDYALKTLKSAACEQGAHVVLNMRALPRGFNEGMIYEGDLAVLLDEKGDPLQGKATGTAASHGGADDPPTTTTTTPTTTP